MIISQKFYLAVFSVLCVSASYRTFAQRVTESVNSANESIVAKWRRIDQRMRDVFESFYEFIIPVAMETASTSNITSRCMKETLHLITGFRHLKPWALEFIDSSAKGITGLLTGTLTFLGAYDECLDIMVPSKNDEIKEIFRGKYCSIDFIPFFPPENEWEEFENFVRNFAIENPIYNSLVNFMKSFKHMPQGKESSFRLGLCVPTGCTLNDVDTFVKRIADNLSVNGHVTRCEVKEENTFSSTQIFIICCFVFVGFLVIVATFLELFSYDRTFPSNTKLLSVLSAFSFISNVKNLLNTEKCEQDLKCFSGIRFITMIWIICGHSYYVLNTRAMSNPIGFIEQSSSFAFQAILNSTVCVETFFFMGGFLVCYSVVKAVKYENQPFSILAYILHRLFRILPLYIFLLMFMPLVNLMGSGPSWHDVTTYDNMFGGECSKIWWQKILFISHYFPMGGKCLAYTWYIDVDFQLYFLAPIILMPIIRWPKIGIILSITGVLISMVSSGIVPYIYDMTPTFILPDIDMELNDIRMRYYYTPLYHAGAYCIGILAGYLYVNKPNLKIPVKIRIIGWILVFVCNFSLLYGTAYWNWGNAPPLTASVIYGIVYRTLWTVGIAWVIICCVTGCGGIVNNFLSSKVFVPLSRLTFAVYVVHPVVQGIYQGSLRTSFMPNHFNIVWLFFGYLISTYMIAFVCSMFIEVPFVSVGKIIFRRGTKPHESHSDKNCNSEDITARSRTENDANFKISERKNDSVSSVFERII